VSCPTIWSSGRYEAVAQRIAPIATEVIDAVERRALQALADVDGPVSFESPYLVVTPRRR
jgi:hypothetical protein